MGCQFSPQAPICPGPPSIKPFKQICTLGAGWRGTCHEAPLPNNQTLVSRAECEPFSREKYMFVCWQGPNDLKKMPEASAALRPERNIGPLFPKRICRPALGRALQPLPGYRPLGAPGIEEQRVFFCLFFSPNESIIVLNTFSLDFDKNSHSPSQVEGKDEDPE